MKINGKRYRLTTRGMIQLVMLMIVLIVGISGACSAIYNNLSSSGDQTGAGGEDGAIPTVAGHNIDDSREGDETEQEKDINSLEEDPVMAKVPEGRKTKIIDSLEPEKSVLVLVNKTNTIVDSYVPHVLVQVSDYVPGKDEEYSYGRPELVNAFDLMQTDAKKEGLQIIASNAYRSYAVQKATFESNVQIKGSVEAANKTSAKPGESEHQTGLAMDLTTKALGYGVTTKFEDTPEGKWVRDHCHEYGFIIRFPKGKEDITGYSYEPWHIRYVGMNVAKVIYDNGWTLEEYLENIKQ